jgi:hypothetical protein
MPLEHPNPLGHHAAQPVTPVAEVGALGDMRQRANVAAGVTTADLPASRNQDHTERGVISRQAVLYQCGIAGFEDPQRQLLAGQHGHLQREHRRDGHR